MRGLVLACLVVVAACSPVDLLSGVDGDADRVTVEADSAPQAAPAALGHCSHYGRATQFEREVSAGVFQYRCIAKE
jgi:hypothetical protein